MSDSIYLYHSVSLPPPTQSVPSLMSICVPQDANYIQFILSVNGPTCFEWFLHPSSGAQITVSTASGTSQL